MIERVDFAGRIRQEVIRTGHDADEGSVTVTQVQALRAAKNAGIAVPKIIIDKAMKYLEMSTTDGGGVSRCSTKPCRSGPGTPSPA